MNTLTPMAPPGVLQYVHILTSLLVNNWCHNRDRFDRIVAMTTPYREVWCCVVTYLGTIATRDQRDQAQRLEGDGQLRIYELRFEGRLVQWDDALPLERAYGELMAALIENDTLVATAILERLWVEFPHKRGAVLTAVAHGAHDVVHH